MMPRRPGLLALLVIMTWGGAGCASRGPVTDDRTGGISLELRDAPEPTAASLYRVELDGTLRFAGGQAARDRRFTWSGPLTDEEIARLRQIIRDDRLDAGRELPAATPSPRRTDLRLRLPGGNLRYRLEGEVPAVEALRGLLEEASRRRLDSFMQRLPKPGPVDPG